MSGLLRKSIDMDLQYTDNPLSTNLSKILKTKLHLHTLKHKLNYIFLFCTMQSIEKWNFCNIQLTITFYHDGCFQVCLVGVQCVLLP